MNKQTIKFCYRKIIDAQSAKAWEKLVFEDSYAELRLQMQNYPQHKQYPSYGELLHYAPEAAQLSARVTPAITGYVQQLSEIMPDVLNNLGRRFMQFDKFKFEIINSHLLQPDKHQVAINFNSVPMLWHNTVGDYLLLSFADENAGSEMATHLMQLQPYLSICSLQESN